MFSFTGINTVRIDQRQHDKGAEHVQYQRSNDVFRFQQWSLYAPTMDIDTVDIAVAAMVYIRFTGDFAEDIFIGNKVFRLTQNQGADGVKGFQFAHGR